VIVDTSAVVAILLREPGHERLVDALAAATRVGIGAPTLVEAGIVLSHRLGVDARGLLARFRETAGIEVVPFGDAHAAAAVEAWLRFGKGRHRAGLNFGDCQSYAVARLAGEPLLFVGEDFAQTDLLPV
jgi:ribonuclease VapC